MKGNAMPDFVKLEKVLAHIESLPDTCGQDWMVLPPDVRPDAFIQATWMDLGGTQVAQITDRGLVLPDSETRCGTAACFAGWAMLMYAPAGTILEDASSEPVLIYPDGTSAAVESAATEELDLTFTQADELFCACNTLQDIRDTISEFKAGATTGGHRHFTRER
jgi:hypothetical protein